MPPRRCDVTAISSQQTSDFGRTIEAADIGRKIVVSDVDAEPFLAAVLVADVAEPGRGRASFASRTFEKLKLFEEISDHRIFHGITTYTTISAIDFKKEKWLFPSREGMNSSEGPDQGALDHAFMRHALLLARRAESAGEVPVGALVVAAGQVLGEGWNQPLDSHDPTAHAEIIALRAAALAAKNYRLPGSTLYVTLEPCPMCAGAIVHARVDRVVYATRDPRSGAAGSMFDLLPSDRRFNHYTRCDGGVLADESAELLRGFFRARR